MGKTQDIPRTGGFMTTETNAQTPSDTPRIDVAKAGIQSAHDAGQLTYESMLFQMVGKLSAEGRTLERELTAAESALAEERSERVGLSCKLTDWTRRCEAAERDCITFRERAEAAESALEKMRESNGDLLMRNVELRHRLDAAERDARSAREAVIEECAKACEGEALVDNPNDSTDRAYNHAIEHAAAAIRSLAAHPAEPAGKGE